MFYGSERVSSSGVDTAPTIEEQVAAEEEIKSAIDNYLKSVNPTQLINLYTILESILRVGDEQQRDLAYLLYTKIRVIQAYRKELSLTRILKEQEPVVSDINVAKAEAETLRVGAMLGIELEVEGALNDLSMAEEVISSVPLYPVDGEGKVQEDTTPSPSPGKDLEAIAKAQDVLSLNSLVLDNYEPKPALPTWVYVTGGIGVLFLLSRIMR